MMDEKEMVIIDKLLSERRWIPGPEAEKNFLFHYKKLNKVLDQNNCTETPNSHLKNMMMAYET